MSLLDAILGDPMAAANQKPGVPAYEEMHTDVQNILLPPGVPRGLSVNILQPVSKNFALTERLFLESGKPSSNNPFAAMMGGPQIERDEYGRPKHYRHFATGGVATHVSPGGAKLRAAGSIDNDLRATANVMVDATGTGRLTLVGQAVRKRFDGWLPASWGASATLRGEDYTATARVKNGPEVGASYNQRLAPGSRLTLGGEVLFSLPTLAAVVAPPPPPGSSKQAVAAAAQAAAGKPVEWTVGAAFDGDMTRTALHLDFTGHRSRTLSAHYLYRVTERASLAAKGIVDTGSLNSMVSVGYKLRFRNAASTLYGQVDTYGNVRHVIEREPLRDLKITLGSEVKMRGQGDNAFGLRVTLGSQPPLPRTLSPILMSRDIFGSP